MGGTRRTELARRADLDSLMLEHGARRREPLKREVAVAESCCVLLAEAARMHGAAQGEGRDEHVRCHIKKGRRGRGVACRGFSRGKAADWVYGSGTEDCTAEKEAGRQVCPEKGGDEKE